MWLKTCSWRICSRRVAAEHITTARGDRTDRHFDLVHHSLRQRPAWPVLPKCTEQLCARSRALERVAPGGMGRAGPPGAAEHITTARGDRTDGHFDLVHSLPIFKQVRFWHMFSAAFLLFQCLVLDGALPSVSRVIFVRSCTPRRRARSLRACRARDDADRAAGEDLHLSLWPWR